MSNISENQVTLEILLMRHGETAGNLEKRYIGCGTDEPLSEKGRAEIAPILHAHTLNAAEDAYPLAEEFFQKELTVFVSPMVRARQTAELMFEGCKQIVIEELKETDFGAFENKNYSELNGNPDYQAWIDSGGTIAFPGGESRAEFVQRTVRGFEALLFQMKDLSITKAAVVAHGGTQMALLSHYTGKSYYDFYLKNAEGFLLKIELNYEDLEKIDVISYDCISCRISA